MPPLERIKYEHFNVYENILFKCTMESVYHFLKEYIIIFSEEKKTNL